MYFIDSDILERRLSACCAQLPNVRSVIRHVV